MKELAFECLWRLCVPKISSWTNGGSVLRQLRQLLRRQSVSPSDESMRAPCYNKQAVLVRCTSHTGNTNNTVRVRVHSYF